MRCPSVSQNTSNQIKQLEAFIENELLDKLACRIETAAYHKEYELIFDLLVEVPFEFSADPILKLFQKHFVIRHSLFRLQQLWSQDMDRMSWCLELGPVNIILNKNKLAESTSPSLDISRAALYEYYMDWSNFVNADSDQVVNLMDSFWNRYHTRDNHSAALEVLHLAPGANWSEIKLAYREKVILCHPDKGGSEEAFRTVREAYEILKKLFS